MPVVLLILVVPFFLGYAMNTSSMHSMRMTKRNVDHLKASYYADAVIQACYMQIRNNANKNPLREAFVNDDAAELDFKLEDEYSDALSSLNDQGNMCDDDVIICEGEFEYEYSVTLSESRLINDQGTGVFGDRIRKLIITVNLKYLSTDRLGKKIPLKKKITHVYDVKVADIRPVGNKYVLLTADNTSTSSITEIDAKINFKSKPNFGTVFFMEKDFLKGATRRIKHILDDKESLYCDEGYGYFEGVTDVSDPETMKVIPKYPCVIISKESIGLVFTMASPKHEKFEIPTVFSVVSQKKVMICGNVMCGVCAESIAGAGYLIGNIVVKKLNEEHIPAIQYVYDKRFDKVAIDDVGGGDEKCAFVVTISPIPQEYIDWGSRI